MPLQRGPIIKNRLFVRSTVLVFTDASNEDQFNVFRNEAKELDKVLSTNVRHTVTLL